MPLRVKAHHEGLDHAPAAAVARGHNGLRLGGVQSDRLFAQHVLACIERLDRPFDMQMVGQRVVDRFDFRIVQECLVIAVAAGDTEARGDARRTARHRARPRRKQRRVDRR